MVNSSVASAAEQSCLLFAEASSEGVESAPSGPRLSGRAGDVEGIGLLGRSEAGGGRLPGLNGCVSA